MDLGHRIQHGSWHPEWSRLPEGPGTPGRGRSREMAPLHSRNHIVPRLVEWGGGGRGFALSVTGRARCEEGLTAKPPPLGSAA